MFKDLTRQERFPNSNYLVVEGHHIRDDVGKVHIFAQHFFSESTDPDNEFNHRISAEANEILILLQLQNLHPSPSGNSMALFSLLVLGRTQDMTEFPL